MSIEQGDVTPASASASTAPVAAAGFRDPTVLTRWLRIVLSLYLALTALSFLSTLLQLKLLTDIQAGTPLAPGAAESNDTREAIIGGAGFLAFLVVVVIFSIWIYRANYNVRQLGAVGMQFSPGWAVGWYFVPVANLWKPYQAMREIWQASADPGHWQHISRGSILPLWWTFFLLSNLAGNASFRLSLRAKALPELIMASTVSAAASILDIVSTAIALMLVTQIFRMQMTRRAAEAFS